MIIAPSIEPSYIIIDIAGKDKIGYEINFTKYFYKFVPLRPLKEISKDLQNLDSEINHLSKEIINE